MKAIIFSLLLLSLPCLQATAQEGSSPPAVDSIAIKQIDSLLNISQGLIGHWHFDSAFEIIAEAEGIALDKLGPESAMYGSCLNHRGIINYYKGHYMETEMYWLESMTIREKALGREHPSYATSLNNLASLYSDMGNNEKAEPLYLESMAIWEKALGRDHPNYASSLNNLAILNYSIGNYEKAELLYMEALAINEKALGCEHPSYGLSLNNLANLYSKIGDYGKSEPLHLEALTIWEKVLGREHPDYAGGLINLAYIYLDMGNYEKAEPLYLEAKDIQEKVLGKKHPKYAMSLQSLAVLYHTMGKYKKAEPLYLESLVIREEVLGKDHPDYANSLHSLADLYERQTRFLEAQPLQEQGLNRNLSRLVNATSFLSGQELSQYVATFQNNGNLLSAYILARQALGRQYGILPSLAYDHALFFKGFLMTSASRLNSPSIYSPESKEINLRLKGYRRRLAAEYTKPIIERKDIAELEEKANMAEKELTRTVAGYAEALQQVKWQEVQAALPDASLALEFTHFNVNFPQSTDSTVYAALLLRPGAEQPIFIPLFEEKELHHLLDGDRERKADYVNELYARADRGMVKLGSQIKSLYDLIWSKMEAAGLEGIKTVYYAPSGVLHRLNLGAIAVDDETILSDHYNLVVLNSTRQLVVPSTVNTQANDALLVGGVEFEIETTLPELDDQPLLSSRSIADAWAESGTRGGSWSYLKWTEKEVERIGASLAAESFKVARLSGKEASEEALKSIGTQGPSPRILHIATHGFFFPDPEIAPSSRRGLGEAEPVFKSSDNPMIRSGLILAGGNYAWQHGFAPSPDQEDGILTAYEISQMNLSNTELVVLSACETGLGDIQGNEGVYGLQRAFKIAGAKYLIMSLWQVPDRETMEFMTAFYRNWLESQMTIPDAFRKTQREMRDRFFSPYSWAGFVLIE
jgi:CHAT domain-containing protein/Tfp pilus assembly protein PilF